MISAREQVEVGKMIGSAPRKAKGEGMREKSYGMGLRGDGVGLGAELCMVSLQAQLPCWKQHFPKPGQHC